MVLAMTIVYIVAATWLSLYGLNVLWLVYRFFQTRRISLPVPAVAELPVVTVQLPIYNEIHVIPRLLQAVADLDYPRDRLEVQVLDDSTDNSTEILQDLVDNYREQGLDIYLIHRDQRLGYKAGALTEGMARAKGQFMAVFDADFVPARDWLMRLVPYAVGIPNAGFVQSRWAHLNAHYSPITMAQAIILDAHFTVEHGARNKSDCLINFNGTAGLWRRECIESVGGWCGDTLTEDLDLSYRAQIAGWRAVYLPEVAVDSELPPQVVAFKSQQFRWAKGSAQCVRRLARPLLHAALPLRAKIEAFLHITGYCSFPLMLVLFLLTLPIILWGSAFSVPLWHLTIASFGPPLSFAVSQVVLYGRPGVVRPWWTRVGYIPLVVFLGSGIAVSNTRAVLEGLLGIKGNSWPRTPKFAMANRRDRWIGKSYSKDLPRDILVDVVFAAYAILSIVEAVLHDALWYIPLLAIYAIGFSLVVIVTLWQSRHWRWPWQERRRSRLEPSGDPLSQ